MTAELVPAQLAHTECANNSHVALLEKSQEFFQICDTEDKGFVTRRDMQRLCGELPLTSEELEDVFDSLDADKNGFLTLEEFSSGFSEFLFGRRISVAEESPGAPSSVSPDTLYQSQYEELVSNEDEEEKHFSRLMESLGASSVFEDLCEVRTLWAELRRDEPHLLSNFVEFLARVTHHVKAVNDDKKEMENVLRRKTATHDDEIQHLYEEMEQQIQSEKDRILLQDSERFLSRSQELEQQLASKEQELEQLMQKQKKLESQWKEVHGEQRVTRVENVKLRHTNEELARELERTAQQLSLAQDQLCLLQEQSSHLREDRDMEMYRITEGLQREKASLLKQLDLLREMNKHLRDERDMCCMKPTASLKTPLPCSTSTPMKNTERRQFSNSTEGVEEAPPSLRRRSSLGLSGTAMTFSQEMEAARGLSSWRNLPRIISIEEDHLPQLLYQEEQTQLHKWKEDDEEEHADQPKNGTLPMCGRAPSPRAVPLAPREQPIGKETVHGDGIKSGPDRLFKIVVVGNSSVGKTSLLRRFCDDCFYPETSATVGIDYSVKTLTVDNSQVALQLWDTAGQERYRSITKQFFRKADGVLVVYDITEEQTFTAVRNWLTSVQEGAGEDIPIMLLGNKTDKESERRVQSRLGEALAKDFQLGFYECSAFSGHNVLESMVHLARILKEQEDRAKEKTVQLVEATPKRKPCCSRH